MPDDDNPVFTQEETAAILEVLWQAELNKRVEALGLAPDQESLLYSLITLPKEAVDLLRKEWFEGPQGSEAQASKQFDG
jgi:hypothetical protein